MNQFEKIKLFINSLIVYENEIIYIIEKAIDDNNSNLMITYFNQNSFNEYYSNRKFREILQSNFIIFCDGKGMAYAIKLLFGKRVDNFNATDLYTKLFEIFFDKRVPIYVIGGNYDKKILNDKAQNKLFLAGYTDGYFGTKDISSVIEKIKNSGARIIGIGMGSPLQEVLASNISSELNNCIILCVGNFFNFHFGFNQRAPKFLRNSGFEWLYRLYSEPGKLWRRYIIGIPLFILRILKYKLFKQ
jgi:exopolysaccharide biosynthesis WecB/TagA/CpsF family protein